MNLEQIFNRINSGSTFVERLSNGFNFAVLSAGDGLIRYRHFGSSANRNTLQDLEWILTVIFEMTPEDFSTKFICMTEDEYLMSF